MSAARLALAERRYRQVLATDPQSVAALEGLGVLLFQQGRAGEAVQLFGRGVALQPKNARLRANLGEALRTVKQIDQAREHLNTAAGLDPELAQTWNSLGLLAADQGRPDEAETAFRKAFRLNPKFNAARVNLGNALHELGRLDEAITELESVVAAEPDNVLALSNLGQMLCETRPPRFAEAETLCRRAVQLAPALPSALNGLGKALRLRGRLAEAKACHERRSRPTREILRPTTISASFWWNKGGWTKRFNISWRGAARIRVTCGFTSTLGNSCRQLAPSRSAPALPGGTRVQPGECGSTSWARSRADGRRPTG